MKVKRRINNNVVLATEVGATSGEGILIGKGIGFNAYPGDEIDSNRVQTIYLPSGERSVEQMARELGEASEDDIALTSQLTKIIGTEMNEKVNEGLFFGLLDHLTFAFKRLEQEIDIHSPLEWEIKHYYPKIYQLGKQIVEKMNRLRGIDLPESEAAFIALHIINNTQNLDSIGSTIELLEISRDVSKLIAMSTSKRIDEESVSYQRFVNHLRYFVLRLDKIDLELTQETNPELLRTIIDQYPKEYQISKKISGYLSKRYDAQVSEDENLYLTLHLVRLLG